MKRHLTTAILVLLMLALAGCSILKEEANAADTSETPVISVEEQAEELQLFNIEHIACSDDFCLYRDTLTDVLFLCYDLRLGYSGAGGLTYMPDPETGLPLTYAKYLELKTNENTIVNSTTDTPTNSLS